MRSDEFYMSRALELARLGLGTTYPNPLVGCVIVKNEKIIGEGWHRKAGEGHAEVNAVNSVEDKGEIAGSTVYVTLEPCSHHGKTPPCADLLVKHRPRRVVVCNIDSNPLVGGRGIRRLREAGVLVDTGVLENEGRELNRRFFTYMEKKRPYIVLKWAQTADGFVARENFDSKWISGSLSRKLVHKWRAEEEAIMVGKNTAKYDNPSLNVRSWSGPDPVRIILDGNLELSSGLNLFDGSIPTVVFNYKENRQDGSTSFVKIEKENFLESILQKLYERKISSVFVEGGAFLLKSFIEQNLWDEARVFTASNVFGKGIDAPQLNIAHAEEHLIGNDQLKIYKNQL
ncbi:MAG: bifunctional diaminohydroxyphosphoribosylaminopyrimidine deaminase/5-amino-6-(5-phosphoribosylamino)uracil reductase RibD [Cytophagales bacterium]|nr:bifunctional diaminohydroxyphosphoribosylaminopyrimidine deaminase/5-amino-6-(5-phosphoribosylamino)uracil reductase RibD [Cytophagales bacterium]